MKNGRNFIQLGFRARMLMIAALVDVCLGSVVVTAVMAQTERRVGGRCEDCDLMYVGMPEVLRSADTSAAWHEGGRRLRVTGSVFRKDARTPAPGIVLYFWHTDAGGRYTPGSAPNSGEQRHGRLRGWVKTDSLGRFTLCTIRPGSYPGSRNPAHIHMLVKEPGFREYWIDAIVFDDDPFLGDRERSRLQERGGSGIIATQLRDGVLVGRRDIVLGRNVPEYP